jgi:formate/nitrite transporter FocA (FNT family)
MALLTVKSNQINRYAYILYIILVIYLVIKGDYEWAVANMGIAMVFDPFDASVKWTDRPAYQKVWLLIHLTLTFAGLAFLLFR